MSATLQITFHNMDKSAAVEARVRERAARLERLSDRIVAIRVAIELRHRRQQKGRFYDVRVHLEVPGPDVVVTREPQADHAHEDIHVAVRDAFDTARRALAEHICRLRGDIKAHARPQLDTANA